MPRSLCPLRAVTLLITLLGCGCVSALKEPPPVAELAGTTADASTEELLAAADTAFARAPDLASVERARELYLEAAAADGAPLAAFVGAARAIAWLVEHEADGSRREELATSGVQIGQLCRRRYPDQPECRYRLALAVGQQARERPATAADGLKVMVALLEELIDAAPELDMAGPNRVLALVLLRAPGWPSGPGDPETGLEHARVAVAAFPDFPPNQLVLGEALVDNGNEAEGRSAFERALQRAEEMAATGEAEAREWVAEARQGIAGLR